MPPMTVHGNPTNLAFSNDSFIVSIRGAFATLSDVGAQCRFRFGETVKRHASDLGVEMLTRAH